MNMAGGAATDPIATTFEESADSQTGDDDEDGQGITPTESIPESEVPWLRTERAMWMDVVQGFRFEYD